MTPGSDDVGVERVEDEKNVVVAWCWVKSEIALAIDVSLPSPDYTAAHDSTVPLYSCSYAPLLALNKQSTHITIVLPSTHWPRLQQPLVGFLQYASPNSIPGCCKRSYH